MHKLKWVFLYAKTVHLCQQIRFSETFYYLKKWKASLFAEGYVHVLISCWLMEYCQMYWFCLLFLWTPKLYLDKRFVWICKCNWICLFQFLTACNFYATGQYQYQAIAYSQMSAQTFGKYLHKISKFIGETMSATYIRFPQTVQERQQKAEW